MAITKSGEKSQIATRRDKIVAKSDAARQIFIELSHGDEPSNALVRANQDRSSRRIVLTEQRSSPSPKLLIHTMVKGGSTAGQRRINGLAEGPRHPQIEALRAKRIALCEAQSLEFSGALR